MGKGKQTIGYHYLFTFVAGFGRGPINELVEIRADTDKVAWKGHACSSAAQVIDQPNLFGGQEKEGGLQGAFRLLMGAQDQVLPGAETVAVNASGPITSTVIPDIKAAMGGLVSEFRGFTALVFDGLVASMNPYLKEWKFRVRRTTAGWHNDDPWYWEKATIFLGGGTIHAMNPAHIVYQCYTDPDWGKGEDPSALDENSFIYAANLFCSEGFGLCLPWYRQEDVDQFVQVVCDTVGALIYQDRTTGKYVFKVLRGDYDPVTIPHFDLDSGLIAIEDDDSASSEAVNEVILTGHDPLTDKDFQVRVANTAAWVSQGGPISRPLELKGIPTRDLGLRRTQMELKQLAPGLKKLRVRFDRRAWQLAPGAVVSISEPSKGIANMVIRLGEITEGEAGSGEIVARAMEDVWALPSTSYGAAQSVQWSPPSRDPLPAAAERLIELGYRDLYRALGPGDLSQIDPTDAAAGTLAVTFGSGSYLYDLGTEAPGDTGYAITQNRAYTASGVLTANVGALDTSFVVGSLYELNDDFVGEMVRVGDEEMLLTDFDSATGTATLERGCTDTIPQAHAAGDRLWVIDDDIGMDGRHFVEGDTIFAKVLPRTSTTVLDRASAATLTADMIARHYKPYPPADVKLDGLSVYSLANTGPHPEPVLTWAHRDRVMQEDQAVSHTDGSIGPEAGVTYTVRIYGFVSGALLATHSGITGTTWTYDAATQAADGVLPSVVRMEFESERDGVASWQKYSFVVLLDGGYGLGYGFNYGGI